eukprot:2484958-Pyramimonas_sp.AAC.1
MNRYSAHVIERTTVDSDCKDPEMLQTPQKGGAPTKFLIHPRPFVEVGNGFLGRRRCGKGATGAKI